MPCLHTNNTPTCVGALEKKNDEGEHRHAEAFVGLSYPSHRYSVSRWATSATGSPGGHRSAERGDSTCHACTKLCPSIRLPRLPRLPSSASLKLDTNSTKKKNLPGLCPTYCCITRCVGVPIIKKKKRPRKKNVTWKCFFICLPWKR